MYVRYELNTGNIANNKYNLNLVLTDLSKIMTGNITSTSQFTSNVCNISASEFYGSINNTVYPSANVALNANAGTGDSTLIFQKNAYAANSTFSPSQKFQLYWDTATYGIRTRIANGANTNLSPLSDIGQGQQVSSNYNNITTPGGAVASWANTVNRILMYVSDYYFAMTIVTSGSYATTSAIFDWEISSADTYAYSVNNLCYPGIRYFNCSTGYGTIGSPGGADYFGLFQSEYMNSSFNVITGQSGETGPYNANAFFGTAYASGGSVGVPYATLYPNPSWAIGRLPSSGINSLNTFTPVYLVPNMNYYRYNTGTTKELAMRAKFPNLYRTSDNIGSPGDTLNYGGVDYMVLVLHKTGGVSINDAYNSLNACYLVPKLINGK